MRGGLYFSSRCRARLGFCAEADPIEGHLEWSGRVVTCDKGGARVTHRHERVGDRQRGAIREYASEGDMFGESKQAEERPRTFMN